MELINKCGCIFDAVDLEKAIMSECERKGRRAKEKYTIVAREDYPCICIAHDHYRVHSLLGKYYFGNCEVVHHKDRNKLNASKANLEPMTSSEHTKSHYLVQYVSEEHKKGFGERMKDIRRRHDVTKQRVYELKKNGMSTKEIAMTLGCGENTVRRRLGMRS